jgi:hypothetical protein
VLGLAQQPQLRGILCRQLLQLNLNPAIHLAAGTDRPSGLDLGGADRAQENGYGSCYQG